MRITATGREQEVQELAVFGRQADDLARAAMGERPGGVASCRFKVAGRRVQCRGLHSLIQLARCGGLFRYRWVNGRITTREGHALCVRFTLRVKLSTHKTAINEEIESWYDLCLRQIALSRNHSVGEELASPGPFPEERESCRTDLDCDHRFGECGCCG